MRALQVLSRLLFLGAPFVHFGRAAETTTEADDECKYILQIGHIQDVTASYDNDMDNMVQQMDKVFKWIQQHFPGSSFGLASFEDKPIPYSGEFDEMGWSPSYCLQVDSSLDEPPSNYLTALGSLWAAGGNDWREASGEALLRIPLSKKMGFAPPNQTHDVITGRPILRIAMIYTDALPQELGQGQKSIKKWVKKHPDTRFAEFDLQPNTLAQQPFLLDDDENFGCDLFEYPDFAEIGEVLKAMNIVPIFVLAPPILVRQDGSEHLPVELKKKGYKLEEASDAIVTEFTKVVQKMGLDNAIVHAGAPDSTTFFEDFKAAIQKLTKASCVVPETTPTVPQRDCEFTLEVGHVQDETFGFQSLIDSIMAQTPELMEYLNANYPGSTYSLASFRDKGLPIVGDVGEYIDQSYCFYVHNSLSETSQYPGGLRQLWSSGGGDWREAQLEAFVRLPLSKRVGFSSPNQTHSPTTGRKILRLAVYITDSLMHKSPEARKAIDKYDNEHPDDNTWVNKRVSHNTIIAEPSLLDDNENFGCDFFEYPTYDGIADLYRETAIIPVILVAPGIRLDEDGNEVLAAELANMGYTLEEASSAMVAEYEKVLRHMGVENGIVIPIQHNGSDYSSVFREAVNKAARKRCFTIVGDETTPRPSDLPVVGTTKSSDDEVETTGVEGDCKYLLQIGHLQDETDSYRDDKENMIEQMQMVFDYVDEHYPNSTYAFGVFQDKPIPYSGEFDEMGWWDSHCFDLRTTFDDPPSDYVSALNDLQPGGGNDWREAHTEAILRMVLSKKVGWYPPEMTHDPETGRPILRVLFVYTDALPQKYRNGQKNIAKWVKKHPNSRFKNVVLVENDLADHPEKLDEDIDYGCGTFEYVDFAVVGEVLNAHNIIPIFMVGPATLVRSDGSRHLPVELKKKYRPEEATQAMVTEYTKVAKDMGITPQRVHPTKADSSTFFEDFRFALGRAATAPTCIPPAGK